MSSSDNQGGPDSAASSIYLLASTSAIGSAFLFTASHAVVRYIGSSMHPFEVAFFSTLFSALFYVPILLREGIGLMRTTKIRVHIVRSFFNAGALVGWYIALPITLFADATALALAGPLFSTLGGVLFLGERMRLRRWSALGVGAVGALIIIQPGFAAFSIGFMFVLLSAVSGSAARLLAKYLTRWDSPLTCSAYVAILQTPITFALALTVWRAPTLRELAWLAGVGVFVALAQVALLQAYRMADIGAMEPLSFTRLIWAALIGLFVFSQVPVLTTWLGGAFIVAASTYIARRETRPLPKSGAPPGDPP